MIKNTKAKGSRNERKSRDLLESVGCSVVKAGGSLGAWDIVGISPVGGYLVQVKSNRRPGSVELETMREFKAPPGFLKLLHIWVDREKWPRVEVIE